MIYFISLSFTITLNDMSQLKHVSKTPKLLKTDGAPIPRRKRKTKPKPKKHTPKRKNAEAEPLPAVSESIIN